MENIDQEKAVKEIVDLKTSIDKMEMKVDELKENNKKLIDKVQILLDRIEKIQK